MAIFFYLSINMINTTQQPIIMDGVGSTDIITTVPIYTISYNYTTEPLTYWVHIDLAGELYTIPVPHYFCDDEGTPVNDMTITVDIKQHPVYVYVPGQSKPRLTWVIDDITMVENNGY